MRFATKLGWISCLLICIGCGSGEHASVTGTVTFNGEDVPDGALRFFPIEGTPGKGAAAVIQQGQFEITEEMAREKEMMAGKYRISVSASRKTGRKFKSPEGGGSMLDEMKMYIPERYNLRTELIVDLEPGSNQHNLDLVP